MLPLDRVETGFAGSGPVRVGYTHAKLQPEIGPNRDGGVRLTVWYDGAPRQAWWAEELDSRLCGDLGKQEAVSALESLIAETRDAVKTGK